MGIVDLDNLPYDVHRLFDNPMILHTQSSIKAFRKCPQKYVFRYLLWLDTDYVNVPFVVGRAVHAGLAVRLSPTIPEEQKGLLIDQALSKPFDDVLSLPAIGGEIDGKLRQGQAQAYALTELWPVNHAEMLLNWKVKEVEVTVRNLNATIASPLEERMAGRLDALVQRIADGEHWLVEHKSRSAMGNTSWINNLEMDTQAIWYYHLAKPFYTLSGFYYDILVKPQHRLGSGSWIDLKERMVEAISETPEKYFACPDVLFNQSAIDRYSEMFKRQIRVIDELKPDKVFMNDDACSDYSGCPYRALCEAGADCANPAAVMELPEIALFSLKEPHAELDDE